MSAMPLISVIVPVYNVAPYLRRCLDTITQQTYTNIEIIIIASTSTDNSVEICEEYAKKDERITLLHSEPRGLSDARNRGIEASHGEYLSFIDSDDYIHPDFLSTLYRICSEYDCDIAQCGYIRVDTNYNKIHSQPEKDIETYSGREMCYNFYYGIPDHLADAVVWNKLYQKKLFSKIRFPFGKIHEDTAVVHQLYYDSEKIGITRQELYFYRNVPTSITGVGFTLKSLDNLDFLGERGEYFKEKGEIELYALWKVSYVRTTAYYLRNLKQYYPDEITLQKNLERNIKIQLREIVKKPQVPLIEKLLIFPALYIPRTITVIGKITQMKRIRKLLSQIN